MDGSGEMMLTLSGGTHHDLTVTPTGIAYPAKQAAGACDSIYVAGPDGSSARPLVDLDVVFSKFAFGAGAQAQEKCHVNAIRYYKDTDSFSVSDREKDAIAFISSTGEVLGSIGATPTGSTPNHAKAEGADSPRVACGAFSTGTISTRPTRSCCARTDRFRATSRVLHYTINGSTAKLDWQYAAPAARPRAATRNIFPTATSSRPTAERRRPGNRSDPAAGSVVRQPVEGLHLPPPDAVRAAAGKVSGDRRQPGAQLSGAQLVPPTGFAAHKRVRMRTISKPVETRIAESANSIVREAAGALWSPPVRSRASRGE